MKYYVAYAKQSGHSGFHSFGGQVVEVERPIANEADLEAVRTTLRVDPAGGGRAVIISWTLLSA